MVLYISYLVKRLKIIFLKIISGAIQFLYIIISQIRITYLIFVFCLFRSLTILCPLQYASNVLSLHVDILAIFHLSRMISNQRFICAYCYSSNGLYLSRDVLTMNFYLASLIFNQCSICSYQYPSNVPSVPINIIAMRHLSLSIA